MPNKSLVAELFKVGLYFLYISLSGIFVFLPPLFGILFNKFSRNLRSSNFYGVIFACIMSLIYELDKSLNLGMLILLFLIIHFILGNVAKAVDSKSNFFIILSVLLCYFGYFFIILQNPDLVTFNINIMWFIIFESAFLIWKK
ncbi:MAG: hypothetical protein E7K04_04205 [Helicobacter sp.]|nr:hypothetical protein [Helicobacter sp.]